MTTIGSPPRPSDQWDVPAAQVADALRIRQQFASRPEPKRRECAHCGDQHVAFVLEPHGARYRNNALVFVCRDRCTPADPERHAIGPTDMCFASAADSFQKPSTNADYANTPWPAYIAAQIEKSQQTRRTA